MNSLPSWVAWLLALQTLAMFVASLIGGLVWKSFQAGAIGSKFETRLTDVEEKIDDVPTTEELRETFLPRELAKLIQLEQETDRNEIKRRVTTLEEALAGFRRGR